MLKRYKVHREMQSVLLQWIKATLQQQRISPMHTVITAREYIRDRDKAKSTIQALLAENRPAHIAFTRQLPVTTESLLSQPLDRMRDWIATWTATKAYLAPSLITTYTTT